jgi:Ca-activated chloride channel family protein
MAITNRRRLIARIVRPLLPIAWALVFAAPTAIAVGYLVENLFDVPLSEGSFRFERPWAALLFVAVPLVLVARGWLQRFAAPRLQVSRGRAIAHAGRGLRPWLADSTIGLRAVGITLLIFALMGPQSVHARNRSTLEGIDIVLTLDMSLSMQATDIAPNRFQATKDVVDSFIRNRPNDRMGAVVFGQNAFTLLPLTTDKEVLRGTISELELGTIDGRGTAIGNAVATSLNRLRSSEATSKIIILLTDGESNSGNVSPEQATDFAATMDVKVFTILMGRSDDAPVSQGFDMFGRQMLQMGQFPVNPELLQDMAARTGGEFFYANDRSGLENSFHSILNALEKSEIEDLGTVYGELFEAFLWPGFLLLGFEIFLATLVFRRWP